MCFPYTITESFDIRNEIWQVWTAVKRIDLQRENIELFTNFLYDGDKNIYFPKT